MASPALTGIHDMGTISLDFVRMLPMVRPSRFQFRLQFRAASTWDDALRQAVSAVARADPGLYVTAMPSHVTPGGRLVVRVHCDRVERCVDCGRPVDLGSHVACES